LAFNVEIGSKCGTKLGFPNVEWAIPEEDPGGYKIYYWAPIHMPAINMPSAYMPSIHFQLD
jgi:hypothetical protein